MNWTEDLVCMPTRMLRMIEFDLNNCGDLLHYYGKHWRSERLREVRRILEQRRWAEKKWREGSE